MNTHKNKPDILLALLAAVVGIVIYVGIILTIIL